MPDTKYRVWLTRSDNRFYRDEITIEADDLGQAEGKAQAWLRHKRLATVGGERWDEWTLCTYGDWQTLPRKLSWGTHLEVRYSARDNNPVTP